MATSADWVAVQRRPRPRVAWPRLYHSAPTIGRVPLRQPQLVVALVYHHTMFEDITGGHRIIDLFAGPGGLDVGATWLGIPTTGIELDENAYATRDAAGLTSVLGDVRDFGPQDFPDATLLAGGPPCQTFTVAGSGTGRRALDEVVRQVHRLERSLDAEHDPAAFADERTSLILEPLRWVLTALWIGNPFHAIVLEQVQAALPVWEAYRGVLERCGYRVDTGVLRTEEYGVPQTRRRAILIARQGDVDVSLPSPTHVQFRKGAPKQTELGLKTWISMGEALRLGSAFDVISNYGSGGDPRNRGRRHSSEPAATITGKVTRNRLEHANGESSRLSHRQAGILQTFPRDYPWAGKGIGQQIGNAIPPRLAVHVLAAALGISVVPSELDRVVAASWGDAGQNPMAPTPRAVTASD